MSATVGDVMATVGNPSGGPDTLCSEGAIADVLGGAEGKEDAVRIGDRSDASEPDDDATEKRGVLCTGAVRSGIRVYVNETLETGTHERVAPSDPVSVKSRFLRFGSVCRTSSARRFRSDISWPSYVRMRNGLRHYDVPIQCPCSASTRRTRIGTSLRLL